MSEGLFVLVLSGLALWLMLWLFILLPAKMARARKRSALIWVLISLLFSPIVAIFLLLVLGKGLSYNPGVD